MQRCTASAALRPFATLGSWPEIPGYAGPWPSATMARANASHTAGFIAVSLAASMASEGAPARPLLKWSSTSLMREAANKAFASFSWESSCSKDAGIQRDSKPQMTQPTWPESPFHQTFIGLAPARGSDLRTSRLCSLSQSGSHQCRKGMLPITGSDLMVKAAEDCANQSRNGCQIFFAWSVSNP